MQVMVPGRQNTLLLQPLLSDTEYKVTITPIYADGEGVSVSAPGKTCKYKLSADLWPGCVWRKAYSFGLSFLTAAIYFNINVGLLCVIYVTQELYINLSSSVYKQWIASSWQIVFYVQIQWIRRNLLGNKTGKSFIDNPPRITQLIQKIM